MLIVDFLKRILIQQILNYEWVRVGDEDFEFEELILYLRFVINEVEEFNENIFIYMENLGFDREMIEKVSFEKSCYYVYLEMVV